MSAVFVFTTVVREPAEQLSASVLPACKEIDDDWTQIKIDDNPTEEIVDDQGYTVGFEVREAAFLEDNAGSAQVVVELEVTNRSEPGQDDTAYFYEGLEINGLRVGGTRFDPDCFGPVTSSQELDPGDYTTASTGFTTTGVRTRVFLLMELDNDGEVNIGLSP